ncbi:hypothetical protein DFH29DRAFT_956155 [Suillus ampliporus]|nr:hypothetical protein DFH29DRAFT_956155 [Suillus ampliporus]
MAAAGEAYSLTEVAEAGLFCYLVTYMVLTPEPTMIPLTFSLLLIVWHTFYLSRNRSFHCILFYPAGIHAGFSETFDPDTQGVVKISITCLSK